MRPLRPDERGWARSVLFERWGGDTVVGHGLEFRPAELDAFVAQDDDGTRVGLLTFATDGEVLEIVTVDALRPREGIGSALVLEAIERAHAAACPIVRVMTTNDNAPAIALYERLGFRIAEVREGAVARAREQKPTIPLVGVGGAPITDEIVFELRP